MRLVWHEGNDLSLQSPVDNRRREHPQRAVPPSPMDIDGGLAIHDYPQISVTPDA
jgi:hypothetical protein